MLLVVPTAMAAGTVTGVTGTVSNGQQIVVSGGGFGTGPNVCVFDNMESGTVGTGQKTGAGSATVGQWTDAGEWNISNDEGCNQSGPTGPNPAYSSTTAHSGAKAFDFNNTKCWSRYAQCNFTDSTEVYWSSWYRLPTGYGPDSVPEQGDWKLIWVQGIDYVHNDWACPVYMRGGGSVCAQDCGVNGCASYATDPNLPNPVPRDRWQRISEWLRVVPGQSAGQKLYVYYLDGNGGAVSTRLAENPPGTPIIPTGGAFKHVRFNAQAGNWHSYWDDIYLAYGPHAAARVEIGNANTYMGSSNLTPCTTPAGAAGSAWTASSITCTVQQGSFANGSNAWVYVIDDTNTPSNGYQVTIGGTSSDVCGDGIVGPTETCDIDLNPAPCPGLPGIQGKTRICADDCHSWLDESQCSVYCGNGVLNSGETCDGDGALNSQTCITQGFTGGTLHCAADCHAFNTASCTSGALGGVRFSGGKPLGGHS